MDSSCECTERAMKNSWKAVILQWYKSLTLRNVPHGFSLGSLLRTSVPTKSAEFLKYISDKLASHGRLVCGVWQVKRAKIQFLTFTGLDSVWNKSITQLSAIFHESNKSENVKHLFQAWQPYPCTQYHSLDITSQERALRYTAQPSWNSTTQLLASRRHGRLQQLSRPARVTCHTCLTDFHNSYKQNSDNTVHVPQSAPLPTHTHTHTHTHIPLPSYGRSLSVSGRVTFTGIYSNIASPESIASHFPPSV